MREGNSVVFIKHKVSFFSSLQTKNAMAKTINNNDPTTKYIK